MIDIDKIIKQHDTAMYNKIIAEYMSCIDSDNDGWLARAAFMEKRRDDGRTPNQDSQLSLVMIVKNEQNTIRYSIQSALDYVGEIIVLDTGSTDNTYHYLKSLDYVNLQRKEFIPWNFSKARNYANKFATKPFILNLDADEEIYTLPKHFKPEPDSCYWIPLENIPGFDVATVSRIYPNGKDFFFTGEVHNELHVKQDTKNLPLPTSYIYHFPEADCVKAEARLDRNKVFMQEILGKPLREFRDCMKFVQLAIAFNPPHDKFLSIWHEGYGKYKYLSDKGRLSTHPFLFYPCLYDMMRKQYNLDNWKLDECTSVAGLTIDCEYFNIIKALVTDDFKSALRHCKNYLALAQQGVINPFQQSIMIRHKREIQLKHNLIEYYLNNIDKP